MSLKSVGTVKDTTTVTLFHPATGAELPNADKTPMTVTIHGPYSARYKAIIREQQQKRMAEMPATGRAPQLTADELEAFSSDLMARCIEDWNVTLEGDEKLPFTPENVDIVLRDFPWVRDQLSAAMGNIAGFLAPQSET